MAKQTVNIDVDARLCVDRRTAELCTKLLSVYFSQNSYGNVGVVLFNDINGEICKASIRSVSELNNILNCIRD